MATGTGQIKQLWSRGGELQQLGQCGGPGLMHGGAHQHLDGFQIDMARLAPFREDTGNQCVDFARNFLMDLSRVFFSASVQPSGSAAAGRSWQIFSFTATSWALRV